MADRINVDERTRRMSEIANDADYKRALSEIDSLMMAGTGTPEGDRLDVLATLVEKYEATAPADHPAIIARGV